MGMVEKKGYRLKKENKNGSAVLPFAIGKRFLSHSQVSLLLFFLILPSKALVKLMGFVSFVAMIGFRR